MARQPDRLRQLFEAIDDSRPNRETTRATANGGSHRTVIQRQAISDAGYADTESIETDQWWFPDEGYLVIDLDDAEVLR
jgi:hypothetical protein